MYSRSFMGSKNFITNFLMTNLLFTVYYQSKTVRSFSAQILSLYTKNRRPILRLCKSFINLKLVQNGYIWIQLGSLQTTMPENLKWKQRLTWSSSLTPVFLSSRYLKTLDTGFLKELTQEIKRFYIPHFP